VSPKHNERLFGPQHWNAIAKDIRTELKMYDENIEHTNPVRVIHFRTMEGLALALAERFSIDNDEFDPVGWLDKTSPNPELYPFGELWEIYLESK